MVLVTVVSTWLPIGRSLLYICRCHRLTSRRYLARFQLANFLHYSLWTTPTAYAQIIKWISFDHSIVAAYAAVISSGQIVGEREETAFAFRFLEGNAIPLA